MGVEAGGGEGTGVVDGGGGEEGGGGGEDGPCPLHAFH